MIFLQSLVFALAVLFILVGIAGTVLPLIPGTLLIWLAVVVYAVVERTNGFAALDWLTLSVITLVSVTTGTADLWLPYLGAKAGGSSGRSLLLGTVGAIIGTLFAPLIGTVIGYALGILISEYEKCRDWKLALKASLAGVAGWGIGTAIRAGGGLLILILFIWQVLSYAP